MTLVAGIDSSTQSCKIVILDAATGAIVRQGQAKHPEGTEVAPDAWWQALQEAIVSAGGLDDVAAISVAAQQHGMVLLDAAGEVVRPALLWNDTRSAPAAAALLAELGAETLAARTGSLPVASFTSTKVRWVRDAEPENAARVAAVALPHDWLSWRLAGYGPAATSPLGPNLEALCTDRSDASGTGYWNPATLEYAHEIFEAAFGRPGREASGAAAASPADNSTAGPVNSASSTDNTASAPSAAVVLPRVLAPSASAGQTAAQPEAGIPGGILIAAGAGDNAGAALGLGAGVGDIVISIGTSGTVFAVTDESLTDASGTVAGFSSASGERLPLVATLNAARVLDATARLLDVDHAGLAELALAAENGSGGLSLRPYFEGERTPNLPDATATLYGMTLASTTRENLARAAMEGLLLGLADGLAAVTSLGVKAERILLIGGAAQNAALQAVAAQVFPVQVVVPNPGEYVAGGAAAQAAWALQGARPNWPLSVSATPAVDYRAELGEQYQRYPADALLTKR